MRVNFKRLGLLSGRAARGCARRMGLTSARLDLLVILLRNELAQVDLAAILCVTEPVVSVMVKVLEEEGWVQRRHPPGDQRIKLCSLTPQGRIRLAPHLNDAPRGDPNGNFSAQCTGETVWLRNDWKPELLAAGIDCEPLLRLVTTELSLFRAMQAWNKRFDYSMFFSRGDHGYASDIWTSSFVHARAAQRGARDRR